MVSRFKGRDYSTLRSEIISFLRTRFPNDWDYTNLADPVVIFAESLARVGDQLHFTIDELRRECDISTAQRASSIYSYALREGYRMMLPRGASGTIDINAATKDDKLKLTINAFDEIPLKHSDLRLYAKNSINADLQTKPTEEEIIALAKENNETRNRILMQRTQRLGVVLGEIGTFNFTYYDINTDFTVDLPEAFIDRELIDLTINPNQASESKMQYVSDVIGSGFAGKIYSLTPKFVGGSVSLSIEFPSNYKDIFKSTDTFAFKYIKVSDSFIDNESTSEVDLLSDQYITSTSEDEEYKVTEESFLLRFEDRGIRGYSSYEDPRFTRENYKRFTQDYSALLTKDDYTNYIRSITMGKCRVFDVSDVYTNNVPISARIVPRVLYIMTDAKYNEREQLFYALQERSSRSDCICVVPFGKDPYTIVIKADCYLLGTSAASVSTAIKSALLTYYNDDLEEKIPQTSMINYIAHKASDKIISMDSCIVKDTVFGKGVDDFSNLDSLPNDKLDELYTAIKSDKMPDTSSWVYNYLVGITEDSRPYRKYPVTTYNKVAATFPVLTNGKSKDDSEYREYVTYSDIQENTQKVYGVYDRPSMDVADIDIYNSSFTRYDPPTSDTLSINSQYASTHYLLPTLSKIVVFIKAVGN